MALGAVTRVETPPFAGSVKRFRALRHQVSEFEVGEVRVSAWHPRLQLLTGVCENVSLHGVGLRLTPPPGAPLCVDDRLLDVRVTLESGQDVCRGEGVVRHVGVREGAPFIGLALIGTVVDLPLLYEQQTRSRFALRCDEAERAADTAHILPLFKQWVADLRSYLEIMQGFLDREEASLADEDRHTREEIERQYIKEVAPRIVGRVHEASHRMGQILCGLSEEQHAQHRHYAQHHMGALIGASPFMRRVLAKPLGYAGDYELMNMLYRPPEEGSTLFGKVMNLCGVREAAARANINRVGYLTDKLRTEVERLRPGRALARLASIGSGPARELEVLLTEHRHLGPALDIMLVDQDKKAIAYCERTLGPLAGATAARIHFVCESVRRLLTGGALSRTMGPRDLIYSAGLFDYLSERSFVALLCALYDAIVPGGKLIVGNVDVGNPTRYFMEYFGEWFLVHRSADQLLEKARFLRPAPRKVSVESEPLGINLFLVIEK